MNGNSIPSFNLAADLAEFRAGAAGVKEKRKVKKVVRRKGRKPRVEKVATVTKMVEDLQVQSRLPCQQYLPEWCYFAQVGPGLDVPEGEMGTQSQPGSRRGSNTLPTQLLINPKYQCQC